MGQVRKSRHPYAPKAGEGWTYRFGFDISVKAGEIRPGGSAAFLEYNTKQGQEPEDHTQGTEFVAGIESGQGKLVDRTRQ